MIAIRYHDSTKHHFSRFAPSLGYLDWATQPNPFRRYDGAVVRELPRASRATSVPYTALYEPPAQRSGEASGLAPQAIDHESIGEFLRCSMGLSAWKQYGQSRWALRVNPSSGNLHPTEAWIVRDGRVCHYAPREHALEERCVLESRTVADYFLVALTSITWREAWKYGERAFRYCQHDTGHAIGALRLAAAMLGWRMQLLPFWSDAQIATLLGLDRDADYEGAEHEDPECIAGVWRHTGSGIGDQGSNASFDPDVLVDAARRATWRGRANRLSSDHVPWPLIEEVTPATRYPGIRDQGSGIKNTTLDEPRTSGSPIPDPRSPRISARDVILRRRSALAFNPRGVLQRDAFFSMLNRLQTFAPPWDVIDWSPQVHLVLFVHRVQDMAPGIYAYLRDASVLGEWKSAMRGEFLWEPVEPMNPSPRAEPAHSANLFLLVPIDAGSIANRLSCDQEIAEDGFFSLSMLARFEEPLRTRGEWFYRRLFWECGLIGQVLYLEAEAAGGRATGIGCYYDEPVHELLGLSRHGWQSLYHFSMGLPVEDGRITSEPGYEWEG